MKIYSYKAGSKGAKALAESLGIKSIRHEGAPLHIRIGETVINWGSSDFKRHLAGFGWTLLNSPESVKKASNKLETFKALDGGVSIPKWTTNAVEASKWLAEGFSIVVRHKLTGHSGEGIQIIEKPEHPLDVVNVPKAPLYVRYIKKKEEYRIHVFRGEVFFVQRKARKLDVPDNEVNWQVRNHANGFIYANQNVEVGDEARREAISAVASLGLDFGAVDIILGTNGNWYVLEVNTACGLEGTTLDKYVEQFKKFV